MSSSFTQKEDPYKEFAQCNMCFNPIVWDDALAQSIYHNRKPFILDKTAQHACPRDGQGNVIKVQGYALQGKKVVWVGVNESGVSVVPLPYSPQQQTQTAAAAAAGEQQPKQGTISQDMINAIGERLDRIEVLQREERNDISELKTIINNYMQYNPTENAFNRLMNTLLKYLPEPELKPVSALDLKESGKSNKQDQEEELNLEEQ